MCKEGECLECMQIDRSQLLEYLDKIARYLINEGIIKTDDMTNEEVPGYVVETVSALRERVEALETTGRRLLNSLPVSEIEIAREAWGNTNTRIILVARDELAATLQAP